MRDLRTGFESLTSVSLTEMVSPVSNVMDNPDPQTSPLEEERWKTVGTQETGGKLN